MEGRILLSGSSQGDSSVMRVKLEDRKKSIKNMSYFAYACKTEGKNGISHLISELLHTLDSSLRDCLFVLQNEVF